MEIDQKVLAKLYQGGLFLTNVDGGTLLDHTHITALAGVGNPLGVKQEDGEGMNGMAKLFQESPSATVDFNEFKHCAVDVVKLDFITMRVRIAGGKVEILADDPTREGNGETVKYLAEIPAWETDGKAETLVSPQLVRDFFRIFRAAKRERATLRVQLAHDPENVGTRLLRMEASGARYYIAPKIES